MRSNSLQNPPAVETGGKESANFLQMRRFEKIGSALEIIGYSAITGFFDWKLAIAIFLVLLGNNMKKFADEKEKTLKVR